MWRWRWTSYLWHCHLAHQWCSSKRTQPLLVPPRTINWQLHYKWNKKAIQPDSWDCSLKHLLITVTGLEAMPLFQAYSLSSSSGTSFFTRNGPISCASPKPIEEQPGPATPTQPRHELEAIPISQLKVSTYNTSIEPQQEWLLGRSVCGLKEPVEESLSETLVYGDIPCILAEPDGRLTGEPDDTVELLPQARRSRRQGTGRNNERPNKQNMERSLMHHGSTETWTMKRCGDWFPLYSHKWWQEDEVQGWLRELDVVETLRRVDKPCWVGLSHMSIVESLAYHSRNEPPQTPSTLSRTNLVVSLKSLAGKRRGIRNISWLCMEETRDSFTSVWPPYFSNLVHYRAWTLELLVLRLGKVDSSSLISRMERQR